MAREYPVRTTLPPPLPRGRLLDTIPSLAGVGDLPRWASGGVTWNPWPCRGLVTLAQGDMCDVEDLVDAGYECLPGVVQTPFTVIDSYNAKTLSGWDGPGDIGEQVGDFLRERGDLMQSWAFARELAHGTAGSTLSLSNTAHAPEGYPFGAAVPVKRGMAILADELGRTLFGGRGIIHMPPSVVEFAGVKEPDSGTLETVLGHRVVADAGYVDMPAPTGDPDADPPVAGGTDAAAGEAWIYASGPVAYAATRMDLIGSAPNEFVDIRTNSIQQWLMGHGLLVFDPCPVAAVLVTLG